MVNKAGTDTCVKTPIERWDSSVYCFTDDQQTAATMGKAYTWHQGYVDGIEFFDNKFFQISATESAAMDPNQRKTMEVCYTALSMGGYNTKDLQRTAAGIG